MSRNVLFFIYFSTLRLVVFHSTIIFTLLKKTFRSNILRLKVSKGNSLGIPETSLRGLRTRTALRVRRSTGMFMWAPAVARILEDTKVNVKTCTETNCNVRYVRLR